MAEGEGETPQQLRQIEAFPWRQAMAFGLGRLRLSSRDFWAMTPRELAAAVEGVVGVLPASLDRAALDALMGRYPDRAPEQADRRQ